MSMSTKLSVSAVLAIAAIGFGTHVAHADEVKTDVAEPKTEVKAKDKSSDEAITAKAKLVIKGIDEDGKTRIPTGTERVEYLEKQGFDAKAVQDKVNELHKPVVVQVQTPTAQAVNVQAPEAQHVQPEVSQAPVVNSNSGLNFGQTSGQVDIAALAYHMANNTNNRAGYSTSEWQYILEKESGGSANIVNPSSGAYGAFQLYGHGEYQGMSLQEQINMAQNLPAGSWVVYP